MLDISFYYPLVRAGGFPFFTSWENMYAHRITRTVWDQS